MNVFPLILVIIWILRAATRSKNGYDGNASPRHSNATQLPSWFGWFLLKLVLYIVAWAMLAESSEAVQIIFLAVGVFALMPTLMIRSIFIPLGMYRTAYWVFRGLWPSGYDKQYRLGACIAAAQALARRQDRERGCAWLTQQLPLVASPHIGYDMLIGLLAAIRGERDTAQAVFHLVDTTLGPRHLRRMARDWLVADAAARGDWQDVIWRGRRGRDSFRWSYAVARMAERIIRSTEAPANWLLVILWLYAPRRRRLLPLLRQARDLPRAPAPAAKFARPLNWQDAIAPLAAMLCEREKGATPQRAQFVSAIHGAAANLAVPSMRARIEERLRKLDPNPSGPGNVDAVMAALRTQLTQLAHTLIEQAPQLAEGGEERPVVGEAIEGMRRHAMQDIATRAQDFAHRTAQRQVLPRAQEWAAWGNLRARAERLLRLSPQAEDSLFAAMYAPMCNFAVFQHNELQHHRLAHDIFCWLHRHAASNPEAGELLSKNAQAYSGMRKR
ncbi:MAG TPA: hypothetical protein VF472_25840 [Burkholderiaceae bacterium]